MIAMYITCTQIFRFLPLFLKRQYSNEVVFMANESKYSTVIPVYTRLCEYSDYCGVKPDDFWLLFSRSSAKLQSPIVQPRRNSFSQHLHNNVLRAVLFCGDA